MSERSDRPRIGRKGNKKVRTGCRTCKIRKVKCDETRPFCLRCTSSGRVCDGYPPVPPRARRTVPLRDDDSNSIDADPASTNSADTDAVVEGKRQRSNTASSSGRSASTSTDNSSALALLRNGSYGLPSPSPSMILGDSNGALALFHARTAPRLASYVDHHFWHELLLQMGDVETAVRHALAAVNSIYDYCEGRGANADPEPEQRRLQHPAYAHGLRKYNRSIGALMQRQSAPGGGGSDASVHLVCCVLFVCIEMLANERQAAMDHFDQGLKLLSSYTAGAEDQPRGMLRKTDIVIETIAPIFRRLSLQAIMLGRETPLLPVFNQIYRAEDVRRASPFRTIQDASQALVAIMDDGLRLAHDIVGLDGGKNGVKYDPEAWQAVRSMMEERRDTVRLDLEVWLDNFSPYASTWVTLSTDPKERLGCLLMRVQYMISIIWISTIAEEEESAFDAHLSSFSQAVHFASEILMIQKVFPDPSTETVFTFDMGVLAPMYFVCTKCRQRRIRRAALHLLNSWPRRENVWDPVQIAKVATRYIEIEDPDALKPDAADDEWPPEWKRIHKVDFEVNKDENGIPVTIALMQRKPLGLDSQWEVIREVIPGLTINLGTSRTYHFTTK